MTLITISTVGFSEVKPLSDVGRGITIVIIILGISLLTYTLSQIASIFIEGELRKFLGRKKLKKQISEQSSGTISSFVATGVLARQLSEI